MSGLQRLRRAQRLGGEAVQLALRQGRTRRGQFFRLHYRPNGLAQGRIALIVSSRHAPRAVDRSQTRRYIREAFRRLQRHWIGFDCVVRLNGPFDAKASYTSDLQHLLDRAP